LQKQRHPTPHSTTPPASTPLSISLSRSLPQHQIDRWPFFRKSPVATPAPVEEQVHHRPSTAAAGPSHGPHDAGPSPSVAGSSSRATPSLHATPAPKSRRRWPAPFLHPTTSLPPDSPLLQASDPPMVQCPSSIRRPFFMRHYRRRSSSTRRRTSSSGIPAAGPPQPFSRSPGAPSSHDQSSRPPPFPVLWRVSGYIRGYLLFTGNGYGYSFIPVVDNRYGFRYGMKVMGMGVQLYYSQIVYLLPSLPLMLPRM
jgi:hypothetical protein